MNSQKDYQRIANRFRIDTDGRSPRLRLSVLAYLVEAGHEPTLEYLDSLVSWLSADLDSFLEDVVALPVVEEDEKEDGKDADPVKNAYDIMQRNSYL